MATWEAKVNRELDRQGGKRVNGAVASVRTQNLTKAVVYASFRQLHQLGYRVEDPKNISEKHIRVLVHHWWHQKKNAAKTIENDLSRLRVFFALGGRKNLVKKREYYLPGADPKELKVSAAAKEGKSWSATGVNIREMFERTDRYDWRLGLMLRMELGFGLRREEVLKCDPHLQDEGTNFQILPGQGKGGRARSITAHERQLLDYVKQRIKPGEKLGWPLNKNGTVATLKQNLTRYSNAMRALGFTKKDAGVTGHNLRAQFAENTALANGLLPPSLGGKRSQMRKEQLKLRMTKIAEALGHHRAHIVAAYFCAFGREQYKEEDVEVFFDIEEALEIIGKQELPDLDESRRDDCVRIRNTLEVLGTDLNLRQAQALWLVASDREGLEWKTPKGEIALYLQAAAITVINNSVKEKT